MRTYNYEQFWYALKDWSIKTFGPHTFRGPRGPILHLKKEVDEVIEALDNDSEEIIIEEMVDCLFLITDAVQRSGVNYEVFMDAVFRKLDKNKERKWGKMTPDKPTEHIR